jgi:hypothetical protein
MARRAHALALAAAIVASATVHAQLQPMAPTPLEERAIEQFDRAIDDYVALHRRMERSLPPARVFNDAEDMFGAADALRQAIVGARPNAHRADVFTPLVSQVFRARLLRAIRWYKHDPADILADNQAERLPETPIPDINKPFPWALGAAVWPTLLRVLPELSEELEYRFVDRDLVLIDVQANLVVDILVDALPPPDSDGGSPTKCHQHRVEVASKSGYVLLRLSPGGCRVRADLGIAE